MPLLVLDSIDSIVLVTGDRLGVITRFIREVNDKVIGSKDIGGGIRSLRVLYYFFFSIDFYRFGRGNF